MLGGIWKECFIGLLSQVQRRYLSVSNIVLHPEQNISATFTFMLSSPSTASTEHKSRSNPDYWLRKGILGLESDLCKEHIRTFQRLLVIMMLNISRRTINEVFREVTALLHSSCITTRERDREGGKNCFQIQFYSHGYLSFLVFLSGYDFFLSLPSSSPPCYSHLQLPKLQPGWLITGLAIRLLPTLTD